VVSFENNLLPFSISIVLVYNKIVYNTSLGRMKQEVVAGGWKSSKYEALEILEAIVGALKILENSYIK
jgi:hypothetical protein